MMSVPRAVRQSSSLRCCLDYDVTFISQPRRTSVKSEAAMAAGTEIPKVQEQPISSSASSTIAGMYQR